MRALPVALLAALAVTACGSATQAGGPTGKLAVLTVTVDPDGARGPAKPHVLKLDCAAPTDSQACGAAAGVAPADTQPTPKGKACTQIYGGPEEATIKGTVRGDAVEGTFKRTNGCEIARWKRVEPLLDQVP